GRARPARRPAAPRRSRVRAAWAPAPRPHGRRPRRAATAQSVSLPERRVMYCIAAGRGVRVGTSLLTPAEQARQGVVLAVHDALFERNERVVGDVDALG